MSDVIDREKEILADTLEKYNRAKSKVERQNAKISSLEKQLQLEKTGQEKARQNEAQQTENDCSEKLGVSEKVNLEDGISIVRQFVCSLSVLTVNECKVSRLTFKEAQHINMI